MDATARFRFERWEEQLETKHADHGYIYHPSANSAQGGFLTPHFQVQPVQPLVSAGVFVPDQPLPAGGPFHAVARTTNVASPYSFSVESQSLGSAHPHSHQSHHYHYHYHHHHHPALSEVPPLQPPSSHTASSSTQDLRSPMASAEEAKTPTIPTGHGPSPSVSKKEKKEKNKKKNERRKKAVAEKKQKQLEQSVLKELIATSRPLQPTLSPSFSTSDLFSVGHDVGPSLSRFRSRSTSEIPYDRQSEAVKKALRDGEAHIKFLEDKLDDNLHEINDQVQRIKDREGKRDAGKGRHEYHEQRIQGHRLHRDGLRTHRVIMLASLDRAHYNLERIRNEEVKPDWKLVHAGRSSKGTLLKHEEEKN